MRKGPRGEKRPADVIGASPMAMEDVLGLIEVAEGPAKKRGPYKKQLSEELR